MLIEKNVISDGTWNKQQQDITFNLDEKIVAVNTLYLVLSFAPQEEQKLQSGSFKLAKNSDIFLVKQD